MRTGWVWAAMALGALLPAPGPAQSVPDLLRALDALGREVKTLREQVASLGEENQDLRRSLDAVHGRLQEDDRADLETAVNALLARTDAGTTLICAADPVTLSGEFRFRNTWSFGDNNPLIAAAQGFSTEHDGTWTDSLLRLGIQYDLAREVTAYVELQAHWAFGDGAPTSGGAVVGPGTLLGSNEPTTYVRVHQGWAQFRDLFGVPGLSARLGRQEILLGNQLQFGNADWFSGFSFDALLTRWEDEELSITGIASKLDTVDRDFNQFPSYFNAHDDDELAAVYFTLTAIEHHELDLYWIFVNGHGSSVFGSGGSNGSLIFAPQVGAPHGGTAYYHTLGGRVGGVFPDLAAGVDWNLEGAVQLGTAHAPGGGDDDLGGFTIEAEFGVTLDGECRFRIFTRLLFATADYVPLYGSRHSHDGFRARYGLHDMFPLTNEFAVQLGAHFDPDPDWTVGVTGLWGRTDEAAGAIPDADYGWEFDLWGEYRYTDHVHFGAGAAVVFPGDALVLVDGDSQVFLYLEARLLF